MLYTLGNSWLVKTIVEEKIGFIGGHDSTWKIVKKWDSSLKM